MEGPQLLGVGDLADHRVRELPLRADRLRLGKAARLHHRDHSLLALGDHDLPGLELLAQRDAVELDVDPGSVARHLRERGGEAGRTAVLQRDDQTLLDQLEARLDQLLACEWVADLHGRPLVGILLAQLLARQHARAADPVTAGGRAVEQDRVADPACAGLQDALRRQQPDAHRVHEPVAAVGGVEERLAADGRHADAVPVVGDPGHGPLERPVGVAEAEAVQDCDRPGAHGDDVAQDPADPGRGPLEGLDGGRVVVALDLEGDGHPLAEVDHTGVLAGALEHARPGGRQALQQRRRVLVAAVLRPEEREDRQLEVVGRAFEQLVDPLELTVGEAELAVERPRTRFAVWPRRRGVLGGVRQGRRECSVYLGR